MKYKYGLIGCGRISINHICAAINCNFDIVAICDISVEAMQNLIKKSNISKEVSLYQDHLSMIGKEDLDIVAIATPSGYHSFIAKDCISRGINVIIEKPFALSIIEANSIIEYQKKYCVKATTCHQNRFNKSVNRTKKALLNNALGKILHSTVHVRWNRNQQYYDQAEWRGTWELDGGAIINQGIHSIDLIKWLVNDKVIEVFSYIDCINHDIEAEDLGIAMFKFKSGSYGVIEATTNVYPKNLEESLYLFGSEGTIKLGGKSANTIEEWLVAGEIEDSKIIKETYSEELPNIYGYGHTPLYKDFVEAISNDIDPAITLNDALSVIELIMAIYKSSLTNTPIKLPLEGFSTADMKQKTDKRVM